MIIRLTNPVTSPHLLRRKPCRQFRAAFTLVELLTVVGIISVLAALLLPAVTKMTKSASSVRCMSNLRQIGIAMNAYAASNDGKLPVHWSAIKDADGNQTWVQRLTPYLQDANKAATVFICPDARLKVQPQPSGNWMSTYSMHERLGTDFNPEDPSYQIRKAGVANQSEVILVADGVQNPANKNLAAVNLYFPSNFKDISTNTPDEFINSTDGTQGGLSYHHPKKTTNALMLDGSVRSFVQGTVQKRNVVAKGG